MKFMSLCSVRVRLAWIWMVCGGGGLTDEQVEGGGAEVFERAMELDG